MNGKTQKRTAGRDTIRLSEKGKSWLRRESLRQFSLMDSFCDAVGKKHVKKVQGKTAERMVQRMLDEGKLTRKSLYLEAIADALGYPIDEVEVAFTTGRIGRAEGGQYVLPEQSMRFATSLLVKLRTYRIAQGVNLQTDELPRVYEAAYKMFLAIREMLEKYPVEELRTSPPSQKLFELSFELLNEGLRPHLTEWRSAFMNWFNNQDWGKPAIAKTIQLQQISFPEITALERDLNATSQRLMGYRKGLEEMIFT